MPAIIPFEPRYAPRFRALNLEWLHRYFAVEPYDEYQLSNPQAIIDNGGFIFLAIDENEVIGTVALMKEADDEYQLTKMSVTQAWQGRGVSKLLMDACLQLAEEKKWQRIILYSNTVLESAIHLYRRYGFADIPLEAGSTYGRTNIKMEKRFGPPTANSQS